VGAQSSQIVDAPGSSRAFSSAFAAASVMRSQSSITTTRQLEVDAPQEDLETISRISSIFMDRPLTSTSSTSGWVPASAVLQASQLPHPFSWQTSAAAKALAMLDRPDPGGPVKSQAWDISCPESLDDE
jgi:adenylate cyclase